MKSALAERGQGRRLRGLQAAGMGYDRIAGQLNGEGVKPRAGERWWGKTVNNILREASPPAAVKPAGPSTADLMLEAMRKMEPAETAPVSIVELRAALPDIDAVEFDCAALALRKDRRVYLSRHDFPQGERPEARRRLVRDGDQYYVAITARGPE